MIFCLTGLFMDNNATWEFGRTGSDHEDSGDSGFSLKEFSRSTNLNPQKDVNLK